MNSQKVKNRNLLSVLALVAIVAAWVSIPLFKSAAQSGGELPIVVRTATLAAPSGSVNPHGAAEWQLYQNGKRELEIEVEDLSLTTGTVLTAFIDGASVGSLTVNVDHKAKLKLDTENGDTVPAVNVGSSVAVRNVATVIVAGVFAGGGPTPTPTATGSPTGTPTGTPTSSPTPTGTPNNNEIYATLSGPTINGSLPRGYAQYEVEGSNREFDTRVRQINLPGGTILTVLIDNVSVGTFILRADGEGRLKLESSDGQTVPTVNPGSTVAIKNDTTTILSGVFSGSINPSPTPTGTPQGRRFEGHLNGAGVTPPVTTNGRGEINILLNTDETQATISGEYEDLSSAQTSAKILVTVGNTTTVVSDLGVFGGTERHFPVTTIPVTAQQVQQLRTGMWYGVVGSVNFPAGEIQGSILSDSDHSDFDGDGSNDLAVFRPSSNTWYTQNSSGFNAQVFGSAADKIVSGDYDGDGRTDVAVYRDVNGQGVWEIKRSSDGGVTSSAFGLSTDKPVRGDFDGDGRLDLAVYRPSNGVWYVQKSNNTGYLFLPWGVAEDQPIPADIDGDGRDDVVVYRPSLGNWYWIRSSDGQTGGLHFGATGDIPVRGDFDGDGKADVTVYRPSTGVWYTYRSSDLGYSIGRFGFDGDIPVAGDYDGDGKADIAVFRPSDGNWYIMRSSDGQFQSTHFGIAGDKPIIAQ